ncbi:MAG: tryptophan--tRNA ligase, partial [Mycoplasmataceae bacterium]|nr:tryptophan--tRNA ligase [Mycoplasmataceae bacterium]MDR2829072.1 tryptophan--tRNA ligase [Mycoplasmataceae bacterium]
MSKKQIILSGAQPTAGSLHLGNYAGMVKPMVDLQNGNDDKDLYLFIADLHAITNPDVDLRETDKKALICTYVASGIDLNKTKLFYQSDVHAHAELGWVLICQSTYGELSRMTQFKDKSSKFDKANGTSSIPAGLLVYPPLMAADILLYDTNLVPVGIDQKQHVELTRNLAERFNNKFGQTFVLPEAYITKETAKIYDLQDPTKKMSKSA